MANRNSEQEGFIFTSEIFRQWVRLKQRFRLRGSSAAPDGGIEIRDIEPGLRVWSENFAPGLQGWTGFHRGYAPSIVARETGRYRRI